MKQQVHFNTAEIRRQILEPLVDKLMALLRPVFKQLEELEIAERLLGRQASGGNATAEKPEKKPKEGRLKAKLTSAQHAAIDQAMLEWIHAAGPEGTSIRDVTLRAQAKDMLPGIKHPLTAIRHRAHLLAKAGKIRVSTPTKFERSLGKTGQLTAVGSSPKPPEGRSTAKKKAKPNGLHHNTSTGDLRDQLKDFVNRTLDAAESPLRPMEITTQALAKGFPKMIGKAHLSSETAAILRQMTALYEPSVRRLGKPRQGRTSDVRYERIRTEE